MKNLKDYLNTKTAIACRTTEQAKFVNEFLANNGGKSLFDKWKYRKSMPSNYHNRLEFSLNKLPNNKYCHEDYYAEEGYDVLEASEFMPSLVGRKIKALVDLPNGGVVRKDEIGEIIKVDKYGLPSTADFSSQSGYGIYYDEDKYELLPSDYEKSSDELKVGDWVILVPENYSKSFYDEAKLYCDRKCPKIPFQIKKFSDNGMKDMENQFINENRYHFPIDCFKKLTYEEVLAYNQQLTVKDDFVLPEKWAVRRTSETCNILNNWCNNQPSVYGTSSCSGYVHSHNYGNVWLGFLGGHYYANHKLKHPDHTEITFEQFKQYVLKEQLIYEKPLTPKECFNSNDPTDIFIPKINKPVVKPDFTIDDKLMEINISLKVKSTKQIKPITINQFSLTI